MLDLSGNAFVRKVVSYLFAVIVGIITIAVMSWNSDVERERQAAAEIEQHR
ncbi:MAG: hypothetical protein Q8O67_14220 [Deltaproteobacteria bacterium]|nr:hypothetical protein [Deltaproteobacteria bacterium]